MINKILREPALLNPADCFTLISRTKPSFHLPLHNHEAFELNFMYNAKGAQRIVGDHKEETGDYELVLLAPDLPHAWVCNNCNNKEIREITIHFPRDLFGEKFLARNQVSSVRSMLEKSSRGILFSRETARFISGRILELINYRDFEAVLEFMSVLYQLSTSMEMRVLSGSVFDASAFSYSSRRIEKAYQFMKTNYDKAISLGEISRRYNMSEEPFSRFYKSITGNTFIDSLTEIRLDNASQLLVNTTQSISDIAYQCGFNNISNFNRLFRKRKGITPTEFRQDFSGTRITV